MREDTKITDYWQYKISDIILPGDEVADKEYQKITFWKKFLDKNWKRKNKPDQLLDKKIIIPDNAKRVGKPRDYTSAVLDQANGILYRKINWEKIKEDDASSGVQPTIEERIRADFFHKVDIAKRATTGLTPILYGYDSRDGIIAMEYMQGVSFSEITVDLLTESCVEFLDNLDKFHEQGLYHGDLFDLTHWWVDPDGKIRLIDPSIQYNAQTPEGLKKIQAIDKAMAIKILKRYGYEDLSHS